MRTADRGLPAAVLSTLAAANVVNNRVLPDKDAAYVGSCLLTVTGIVAMARRAGCTWGGLGLAPDRTLPGLRTGAPVAVGAVTAMAMVASRTGVGRAARRDQRASGRAPREAWQAALVRVPLGTVLLEEVAFRGVVPALLTAPLGKRKAALLSCLLFGAWHVLPSADLAAANQAVRESGFGTRWRAAALAVTTTAAAGAGLQWLRCRSDSVVAPALVHWATNATGYILGAGR